MRKYISVLLILELLSVVASVYIDYGAGCFTNEETNAPPDACTTKENRIIQRKVEKTINAKINRVTRRVEKGDVNRHGRELGSLEDFCSLCLFFRLEYCILFGCEKDRRVLLNEESLRLGLADTKPSLRRSLQKTVDAEEILRLELISVVNDMVNTMVSSPRLSPICSQALSLTQCDAMVKISFEDDYDSDD